MLWYNNKICTVSLRVILFFRNERSWYLFYYESREIYLSFSFFLSPGKSVLRQASIGCPTFHIVLIIQFHLPVISSFFHLLVIILNFLVHLPPLPSTFPSIALYYRQFLHSPYDPSKQFSWGFFSILLSVTHHFLFCFSILPSPFFAINTFRSFLNISFLFMIIHDLEP